MSRDIKSNIQTEYESTSSRTRNSKRGRENRERGLGSGELDNARCKYSHVAQRRVSKGTKDAGDAT